MKDPDLAQIFRNAFPSTLDTTVLWHVNGTNTRATSTQQPGDQSRWTGAQTFIVTGDINAEWLRDSTNQLTHYQRLAATAPDIYNLILGAINTQTEFVIESAYCNAFQPPRPSGLLPTRTNLDDFVHPVYDRNVVFECKYELDSLANFLSLGNQFHASTGSTEFVTERWLAALRNVLSVLDHQSQSTFDPETHIFVENEYRFTRAARTSTETLALYGIGNPLANGTGLVRSAFRPSDDATTLGFLIPSNAMMSVELQRTAVMLESIKAKDENLKNIASDLKHRSEAIRQGILDHGTTTHPIFGKVFAYETDGYSSHLLMDDANIPSLLSLPMLGFIDTNHKIYQNTRRMLLSSHNPYYLSGKSFSGIGGPHVGLRNAWPMSVLVQAITSSDPEEILTCLEAVKNVSVFGLINESVDVERGVADDGSGMTRGWFAWANSVFAQTIIKLAEERPELVFQKDSGRYVPGKGFE